MKEELLEILQCTSTRLDLLAIITALGTAAGAYWSNLDGMVQLLGITMAVDYVLGWMLAVIFKKSPKTDSGGANSSVGFKGLCKKGVMLPIVYLGYAFDQAMGTNMIQMGVILAFLSNELLSITENLGVMGIPYPEAMKKAIDILQNKETTEKN